MSKRRDPNRYRPAAGIVVFNSAGKVFMGHRNSTNGPYVWQFPQGGIDEDEKPYRAAVRELFEETGIIEDQVELLSTYPDWLYYDFPKDLRGTKAAHGWLGQRQKWFAFRYHGKDTDVNLDSHGPIEFSQWRWDDLGRAPKLVVPFKRPVYERVCAAFTQFESPNS